MKKKKSIAIFGVKYFPSKGGTSRVVESLIYELKDQFDISIYCYKHEKATHFIQGVKTIQFPEIRIKGLGVFLYYLKCCWHLMRNGQYDLVHLHKMDGAFFLPILGLKFKLAATSHGLPYLNDKWSVAGKLYFRIAERLMVGSKAALTSVSKTQVEYFNERYNNPFLYIPNGIHPIEKISTELAVPILKKYQIQDDYLFFAARRLIPLKGCHTLIEALKIINYKGNLVIAADTEQLPAYTEQLKTAGKGLNVKFIGYVSNLEILHALIFRSKLFVFPSEMEAMSMMLLEVGSIGRPMICSNIPQNKAVLEEGEVLFFESKNANDLANKLTWALENEIAMERFAQKAKQKIEEKYLVSKVAAEYADFYNKVISS